MSTDNVFPFTVTTGEHEYVGDALARSDSRRQTKKSIATCGAGRAVAMRQLASNPYAITFSNESKHKGSKAKKCKRKQRGKKNKGGQK
ncbi:hypothetical protein C2U62_00900 [Klebsiella michiganensis]|nr:hypothetical protein [Klebsiella michiganensis]